MNSIESSWFATAKSQFSGDLHTSSESSSCSMDVLTLACLSHSGMRSWLDLPQGTSRTREAQASIFLHLIVQNKSRGAVTALSALWKDTADLNDKGCGVWTENPPLLHGWDQTQCLTHTGQGQDKTHGFTHARARTLCSISSLPKAFLFFP